jgi:hypothetical protein
MRRKPGNLILLILAVCLLSDVIIVRPNDEGDFLISLGVIGALMSRAFLEDPQSVMVCLLGLALVSYAVLRNHAVVDRESDIWYVFWLFVALAYALWEKILGWLSA